jgi:hypothetical protein
MPHLERDPPSFLEGTIQGLRLSFLMDTLSTRKPTGIKKDKILHKFNTRKAIGYTGNNQTTKATPKIPLDILHNQKFKPNLSNFPLAIYHIRRKLIQI